MKRHAELFVLICSIIVFLVAVPSVHAAPKRVKTAQPDNCALCHGKDKVLPGDHRNVKKMDYRACKECHVDSLRLAGKFPGSHIHSLSGVSCDKCHDKAKRPQEVKMDRCVTCHNPQKLVEKTAKVKPENPHTSPHYGTGLDCNLCHHQHGKSENYCSQCHEFGFAVP